jgi:hypothetical protein
VWSGRRPSPAGAQDERLGRDGERRAGQADLAGVEDQRRAEAEDQGDDDQHGRGVALEPAVVPLQLVEPVSERGLGPELGHGGVGRLGGGHSFLTSSRK